MNDAIDISGLIKSYGATRALDGLDLKVGRGEVHGFLGPNGAGKSTTIRILLGLLRADAGKVLLLGGDPWTNAVALHRRLAYVPGDVELWPNLTGGEVIDLLSQLRGRANKRRRDMLIERFDFDPTKKCRTYSKGNRQKVALIAAFASEVELLLLDEPTAGLDPLMEAVFQQTIHEAKLAGCTVLLSSHILAQVEVLADRVSIIRQGRIIESGTLSELRHLHRISISAETMQPADHLTKLPGVHGFECSKDGVHFEVDGSRLDEAMKALAPLGTKNLVVRPPTLEQLLMRHYGDQFAPRSHASGEAPQ